MFSMNKFSYDNGEYFITLLVTKIEYQITPGRLLPCEKTQDLAYLITRDFTRY